LESKRDKGNIAGIEHRLPPNFIYGYLAEIT